jgi:hypothetical protein
MPVTRIFLYLSLRDPIGGAFQIITCLSESPVKEPPFQVPPAESHMERDDRFQSLFMYLFTQGKEELGLGPQSPVLSCFVDQTRLGHKSSLPWIEK